MILWHKVMVWGQDLLLVNLVIVKLMGKLYKTNVYNAT